MTDKPYPVVLELGEPNQNKVQLVLSGKQIGIQTEASNLYTLESGYPRITTLFIGNKSAALIVALLIEHCNLRVQPDGRIEYDYDGPARA